MDVDQVYIQVVDLQWAERIDFKSVFSQVSLPGVSGRHNVKLKMQLGRLSRAALTILPMC